MGDYHDVRFLSRIFALIIVFFKLLGQKQYGQALKSYLEAGAVATYFFSEPVPKEVFDDTVRDILNQNHSMSASAKFVSRSSSLNLKELEVFLELETTFILQNSYPKNSLTINFETRWYNKLYSFIYNDNDKIHDLIRLYFRFRYTSEWLNAAVISIAICRYIVFSIYPWWSKIKYIS